MPDQPRRGTGRLLEGIVVLLSILAAFFLEGWRAEFARLDDHIADLVALIP